MNTHLQLGRGLFLMAWMIAGLPGDARAQGDLLPAFEMRELSVGLMLPGDFNRDGRADLIGSPAESDVDVPTDVVVLIQNADGSFQRPRSLGIAARPLAVADLNGDARLDVVIRTLTSVAVLPGNGNGTFGAARTVENYGSSDRSLAPYALVADFVGDAALDIAVGYRIQPNGTVRIHPGNGGFTFGEPVNVLVNENTFMRAAAGDVNNDGREDIALAPEVGSPVVLINQTNGMFAAVLLGGFDEVGDVALADLNGDENLDVILATAVEYAWDDGHVVVRLGRGDGTFADPTGYDSGAFGEYRLAVGDFTRDGLVDIATGNLSASFQDDVGVQAWDSVSILRGDGTGALEPAVTLMLGVFPGPGEYHRQTDLKAADLNGDGHIDLLASPGTVIINRSPAPNRPPIVFAGPDATRGPGDLVRLDGTVRDPDGHWLTYRWTDPEGRVISTGPKAHPDFDPPPGAYTFTLTVDDGHGGIVSDSVTLTFLSSEMYLGIFRPNEQSRLHQGEPFTIQWHTTELADRVDLSFSGDNGRTFQPIPGCTGLVPSALRCVWGNPGPPTENARIRIIAIDTGGETGVGISARFTILGPSDPALPPGWQHQDVGSVGAAGAVSGDGSTITIAGSGADIWGRGDEFHGAFTTAPSGSFEITARVLSVENVDQWTKAGVMIRGHLGPSSAQASLFVTPTTVKGTAFQRRRYDGATTQHTSGPAIVAPIWLKLAVIAAGTTRQVFAFVRDDNGGPWIFVGRDIISSLFTLQAGLVVSSHRDGRLARATFDNVAVRSVPAWQNAEIGTVGLHGTTTDDGATVIMEGSGADIWGTADAFRFRYASTFAADARITARILSIEATHQWAKAGVMMRESLHPGARHVMLIVSPGRGVAMQYRAATGGVSANVAVVPGTAPEWLRLTRHGNRIVGEMSNDGVAWSTVGALDLTVQFGIQAGIAVTSHNNSTLATAVFDSVALDEDIIP